ncbi:MAG: (2Fe-2S) ferredoxin domain-containing protein [Oculatellaceae cyanobacterium bins.114]|nr:(2Fe-2S) ferredoxin domain-containing protein [Oculatellaceae cyanobacterium bins.114]
MDSFMKRRCVLVCQHRSCARNGSEEVLAAFQAEDLDGVYASGSDCMGQCASGPTVQVMPDRVWYCRVTSEDVTSIVEQHLKADQPVESLLHPRFHPPDESYAPSETV